MSIITEIENAINKLDAATFQKVCDTLFSRIYPGNIFPIGLSNKNIRTSPGTPDTYISDGGDYILVEYTTQQSNLFKKLKLDINKCFTMKTNVKTIVIAYTGRISKEEHEILTSLCAAENLILEMYCLAKLSDLICYEYPFIAKEFLGLQIDSGQILPVDQFLQQSDGLSFSTPLNVNFYFRNEDLKNIKNILLNVNIVIISGNQGCGKTKIAAELLNSLGLKEQRTPLVVKSKYISILEDFQRYFIKGKRYVVLIDDANQLTQFDYLLEYVFHNFVNDDFKIIITVRDYAVNVVKDALNGRKYEHYNLMNFKKDEVISIIKNNFNIGNQELLEAIAKNSKNNIRIAYMLAKMAVSEKNIKSIYNTEQILSAYYFEVLNLAKRDDTHLIILGLISFIGKINLNHLSEYEGIFQLCNINSDDFKKTAYNLHDRELLNIQLDKVIIASDEILFNYLFYYVFIEKKLISLSELIQSNYSKFKKRIVYCLNSSLALFYDKSIAKIRDDCKQVFSNLVNVSQKDALEFCSNFGDLFELEAINFLNDEINILNDIQNMELFDININIRDIQINDTYLLSLVRLSDGEYYIESLELMIKILTKSISNINEKMSAIYSSFIMTPKDLENSCFRSEEVIKKLLFIKDDDYIRDIIFILLKNYVKLVFEWVHADTEKSIRITTFEYNKSVYKKSYRNLLFKTAEELFSIDLQKKIIISEYESLRNCKIDNSIIKDEIELLVLYFSDLLRRNCGLAQIIIKFCDYNKFSNSTIDDIKASKEQQLYKLIYSDSYNKKNQDLLIDYGKTIDEKDASFLLENINLYFIEDKKSYSKLSHPLEIILQSTTNEVFTYAFRKILFEKFNLNFYSSLISKRAYSLFDDYYFFLKKSNYEYIDCWKFDYFESLVLEKLNKKIINEYLKLVNNYEVKNTYSFRQVEHLIKYKLFDSSFVHKYIKIFLKKDNHNTINSFIHEFFNHYVLPPKMLFELLNENLELIRELYFVFLSLGNTDLNGIYLNFFSNFDLTFLDDVVKLYTNSKNNIILGDGEILNWIWNQSENFKHADYVYCKLIEYETVNNSTCYLGGSLQLLFPQKDSYEELNTNQFNWIKCRMKSKQLTILEIKLLSRVVCEFSYPQREEIFNQFILSHDDFSLFSNYALFPSTESWWGSAVPHLNEKILHLERILEHIPTGIQYIKHMQQIQIMITRIKNEIEREKENDLMNDFPL